MRYTRRPTWPDQPARRDYVIRREDLQIGRVYLTNAPDGDRFVWSIYAQRPRSESTGRADQRFGGNARQGHRRDAEELWTDAREGRAAAAELTTLSACRPAALSWIPRPVLACGHEHHPHHLRLQGYSPRQIQKQDSSFSGSGKGKVRHRPLLPINLIVLEDL